MDKLMEKIKDRIAEKNSPIKSLKALAEAIGMSEGGFYMMFKKDTMKLKTKEAICNALNVSKSYFDEEDLQINEPSKSYGGSVLQKIGQDIHEVKQAFEEQLRVKDQQIAGLLESQRSLERMLEVVLGKSKGAIEIPLTAEDIFELMADLYALSVQIQGFDVDIPAMKLGSKGSLVGGTPFSYTENTVRIAN